MSKLEIEYFVHATSSDNEQGIASGWRQTQLSNEGRRQARDLGKLIAGRQFDAVFCSDLDRAVESARLVFGEERALVQD